jgi:5'-nucleotidase
VLPFVNNLWTTTLTGAQFKTALEQQWQRDAAGAVPSRPYLQLGLSDNVSYTFDPTLPEGQRITSILVNGAPIDPARPYRIGSFSFLLQGGDNFRVFAQGADTRDSGLIDRDAWITYLGNHQGLTPSFARRSVQVTGAPTAPVQAGSTVAFTVSKLDLTSLGSPANTSLAVTWSDGTALGTVPVSEGTANVSLALPADLEAAAGYLTLTASPSGTAVRVPLTVLPRVEVPAPGSQPGAGTPAPGGVSSPGGSGTGTKSGTGAVRSGAETRTLASTGVDPIGGVAAGVLLALIGAALTGGSLRRSRAAARRS